MNRLSRPSRHTAAIALTLLGISFAAVPAGAQTPDKPVTLNLQNVPLKTALVSLFKNAGISQYVLDTNAQGLVNVQVSDVPFSVALRQVLRSVQPALDFTDENGSYHIVGKSAAAPLMDTALTMPAQTAQVSGAETRGTGSNTADQPRRYYPIHINKYDSFVIASLLGSAGIVDVPPNITRGSGPNGRQQGGFGGQQNANGRGNGFGGQQSGFGGQQGGFGGGQQGGGGGRRRGGGGFGGGYGG